MDMEEFIKNQKEVPLKFVDIVNNNFWDLIAHPISHPCEGCYNYEKIKSGEFVVCHCTIGTPIIY